MVSSNDLLVYVRDNLSHTYSSLNINLITEDTDLIAFGIDSIQLLQLIAKIEDDFGLSFSLEKLAYNSFILSINTLLDCID